MPVFDRWTNPTIDGDLVLLRPIVSDDAMAMFEMAQEPEGSDLTSTTQTFTLDQIAQWCATRDSQTARIDLAIVERVTGDFAGEAVLNEFRPDDMSANFRISLRGPAWYGRGLGTEATRLLVSHGLSPVGLRRITLEVLERNPRARRTYEKAGFTKTGTTFESGETWIHMVIETGS